MNGYRQPGATPVVSRLRTEPPVSQGNPYAVRRLPADVAALSNARTTLPDTTNWNSMRPQSQPLRLNAKNVASTAIRTLGNPPPQQIANLSGALTRTPPQYRTSGTVTPAFVPVPRPPNAFPPPALIQRSPARPNHTPAFGTTARPTLGVASGAPIPPHLPSSQFVSPLTGPLKSQLAPPRPALPSARFPTAAQRSLDRRLAQPQTWTAKKLALPSHAPSSAIQRMDDGKWKLGPVKDAANDMKANPQYKDLLGRGVTIHHKISQVQLLELLKINQRARGKSKGASRFWGAVAKATNGMEGPEHKLILNIPANLEIGPKSVVNNPGSSFDGNTKPTGRGRSYTFRSEQLNIIDRLFLEKGEDLTDEDWDQMAAALEKATKHHGTQVLSAPLMEQWRPEHGRFRRERTDEEKARVASSQASYLLYNPNDLTVAFRGTQDALDDMRTAFTNPIIALETPTLALMFGQIDDVS
jgi:hypothetical protein